METFTLYVIAQMAGVTATPGLARLNVTGRPS
jgi:hypothetical protein